MGIFFKVKKLAKACSSCSDMSEKFGTRRAKKLGQRLMELRAATCLAEISRLPPPRCHELGGNRSNQFSVDLDHPYRLLFTPDHDPIPRKSDGGIDLWQVTRVLILGIEDTH